MTRLAYRSLLLLLLGVATPARAEEESRRAAGEHYQRGLEIVSERCRLGPVCGDYNAALAEFERAYALSPNFEVLYNIGQANVALGRPRKAIDALTRYSTEGGERVPPARRVEVQRQIAQLESSFAVLGVTSEPVGAQVTVDGADAGTTPLAAPLKLVPGTHVVSVSRPGAATETRVVTLAEGQHERLSVTLKSTPPEAPPRAAAVAASGPTTKPGAPVAAPHDEARAEAQHGSSFPTGYVLIGAGVALGGVTVAHYVWNHGRVEDYRANQAALETDTSPGRHERQAANNELATSIQHASVVTVVLGAASGALAAAGVVLLVVEHGSRKPAGRATAPNVELALPRVAATRDSLALSWEGRW